MAENEWVTGIIAPVSRGIALLITGRGPPCRCTYIYIYMYIYICIYIYIFFFKFDIPRKTNMSFKNAVGRQAFLSFPRWSRFHGTCEFSGGVVVSGVFLAYELIMGYTKLITFHLSIIGKMLVPLGYPFQNCLQKGDCKKH